MNDDQTAKMLKVLADAFDRAAVHCAHKDEAARFIVADLVASGFKIEPRRKTARAA